MVASPDNAAAASRMVVHIIPHTHWDREWYLPRGPFQARLVAMMAEVLDFLERDESLRFLLDGQTVLVEDFLDLCPAARDRVERLAVTGRLQVGPWYVLADQLIPSGEAMIRNLLAGAEDARALGADPMAVAYAPDAFGHSATLPTIAAEFGIRHAVLWRGVDVTPGRDDSDLFRWRGPDGAHLLAYHLPRSGYEVGAALPADPDRLDQVWPAVEAELLARASCRHVALFVGADHHAIRPDLAALRDALTATAGRWDVRISSLVEYFRAVERAECTPADRAGELRRSPAYAWSLQGVHATRLPIKRASSALETHLERDAEPLVALAPDDPSRQALLRGAWRLLLQNQFHDSLAGTVADPAADEIAGRFARARALADEAVTGAMDHLAGRDPDALEDGPAALLVWNPTARARSPVVIADLIFPGRRIPVGPPMPRPTAPPGKAAPSGLALVTEEGETLPAQILHRRPILHRSEGRRRYPNLREATVARVAFRPESLRGLTMTRFGIVAASPRSEDPGVVVRGRSLSNGLVSVDVERDGSLTVGDGVGGRVFRGLLVLRHEGDEGDAYTVHRRPETRLVRRGPVVVVGEGGALVGWLRADYRLKSPTESVAVSVLVWLTAGSPTLRCTVRLDNRARDHRLLADLPLGLAGPLLVGTALGTLTRGPEDRAVPDHALEHPGDCAPAHRFVAALGGDGGLGIFQPGFFEYAWSPAGKLSLTLLRAIGQLSRPDLPERPGHAAWPVAIPGAQCQGVHTVRLALAPLSKDDGDSGRLHRWWEDAMLSPWGRWVESCGAPGGPAHTRLGCVTLEGPGLVFSTCKPAASGGGVVLRCWNDGDEPVQGAWRLGRSVRNAILARADERPMETLSLTDGGTTVRFVASPRTVVTVLVS